MNGLFGLELPTSVNFVIAFVVVLALIGAATWLVRRFGAPRTRCRHTQSPAAARGDRFRGGRRAAQAGDHPPRQRRASADGRRTDRRRGRNQHRALRRGGQPRGARRSRQRRDAAARHAAARHDALAIAARTRGCRAGASGTRARRRTRAAARPRPPPARGSRATRRADQRRRRSITARSNGSRRTAGACAALPAPKIAPVVQIDPHAAAAANDQNLANMAHQLEAALRRPVAAPADAPKPIEQKRIEPVLRPVPKAAAAAAAPVVAPQKQPVHSIEQEMASLLGRPGKS